MCRFRLPRIGQMIPSYAAIYVLLFYVHVAQASSATYLVTFTGTWNAADVTGEYPTGAHFTELIGATHVSEEPLWRLGGLATPGIEKIAERGRTAPLLDEINGAVALGTVSGYFSVPGIDVLPGSGSSYVSVPESHPYVSAISMVAPSPDWFVGVSNIFLRNGNEWVADIAVDLVPWDAGTEQGTGFSLNNPDSIPHGPISGPVGEPFVNGAVLGTLRFELVNGVSSGDVNGDGVVNGADVLLATQFVLGKRAPTIEELLRGDIAPIIDGVSNPDGVINTADLLIIQNYALSLL